MSVATTPAPPSADERVQRRQSRRSLWRVLSLSLLAGLAALTFRPDAVAAAAGVAAAAAAPAVNPAVHGDYVGTLGPLHLRLHVVAAADGTLSGSLDSPDQGATGIACTGFRIQGQTLSFEVPAVHGSWRGTIQDGGATLVGTWSQGTPLPLKLTRDTFIPATHPSAVDGFWLGTLQGPIQSLRIQLSVRSDSAGREFCALDSLDQGAFGLPCANVVFSGTRFSFDVPVVHGHWSGVLSANAGSLQGTWSQGRPLALNFQREVHVQRAPPPPKVTYDPAIAPVGAARMPAVIAADLHEALQRGALAPGTDAGISIGVVRDGVRRVFVFGTADFGSIFEIGSITKTFTGLVLAQMIEQGKVRLDDPVRELLPPGTASKPPGEEITLLDLITHHSGLPRMPDNFRPADPTNPYADYHAQDLYAFVARHGLAKPADASFLYSNLGVGLLGQALADRAGTTYGRLVTREVIIPLGLRDTVTSLTASQRQRLIQGHTAQHRPQGPWDIDALAGAGAIRSTAADMLTYLQANLRPQALPAGAAAPGSVRTLPAALQLSHELRADAGPAMRIAFAWLYDPQTGDFWHNGATGGYSAYAFFNPKGDYAAIVLMNTTVGPRGGFADRLGLHISQRFAGKPAISLSD